MNVETLYSLGFGHYERGDFAKAIALFTQLVLDEPMEERFWRALASARQMAGKYQEAVQAWALTSAMNLSDPIPHFHAAECLISLGNREDASKALSAAEKMCQEHQADLKQRILALREMQLC